MADTRDWVRRSLLVGVRIVQNATAGVVDAAHELADPRVARRRLRDQELELAQQQGRWLSDDERAAAALAEQARLQRRRTLLTLLVISLLVPLFWPLALVWAGLLWWPRTTGRVLWIGLSGLGLMLLSGIALLVWLLLC